MDTLKISSDTLFILLGAIMVLAMHAGFAFLEARHGAQEKPGQRARQDPLRFLDVDGRVFLRRLRRRLWRGLSGRRRQARGEERLRARQIFLPAHVRGRGAGDRLGRHRGARAIHAAARGDGAHRRVRLSVLRRHRVERQVRRAGVAGSDGRRQVSRFRRIGGRARRRRLDRARRRDPARRAHRTLSERRRSQRAAAVEHSRFLRSAPGSSAWAGSAST